jgi:hypothetical protein
MPCYHVNGPGFAAIVCTRGTVARVHVDDGRGRPLCGRGGTSPVLATSTSIDPWPPHDVITPGRATCRVCLLVEQRAVQVAYAAPSLPFGAP